jgi:hypothetical protein
MAFSPVAPALPDPQLDEHRVVVRDLFPYRSVRLAVGDMAERGAIDPGQHPPVDDDVIDELSECVVPAADRHVLRDRGEVGVGRLAIVALGLHLVMRHVELAVEVL